MPLNAITSYVLNITRRAILKNKRKTLKIDTHINLDFD